MSAEIFLSLNGSRASASCGVKYLRVQSFFPFASKFLCASLSIGVKFLGVYSFLTFNALFVGASNGAKFLAM